jgi:hypothetical protein
LEWAGGGQMNTFFMSSVFPGMYKELVSGTRISFSVGGFMNPSEVEKKEGKISHEGPLSELAMVCRQSSEVLNRLTAMRKLP